MKRLFFALLFAAAPVAATAADAVLKATRGHVSVRPAATRRWIRPEAGYELQPNDQVMTAQNGAIKLSFANGATMLVRGKSRFSLGADRWGKLVRFRTGEFLIGLRRKLDGGERFRVRTPVAVAAVTGTVFWGKSDPVEGTSIACFTGAIDVWAKGAEVTLQPGQLTAVRPGGRPSEPAAAGIPPDYIRVFEIDGSLQGIDEQIAEESAAR